MKSRLLVTGRSGFIGSNLATALEGNGHEVIGLDFGSESISSAPKTTEKFLLENSPDAIFHVGANADTLDTRINEMMTGNYLVTKAIMDYSVKNGTPVIYSSSAANYGSSGSAPSNTYAWSKFVAEDYVRLSGGVSLRYFNVYGPGEGHKGKMASFAFQAMGLANEGQEIKLFPGKPRRDFVYVRDVCSANIAALEQFNEIRSGVFDVGTGVASSFEEVLNGLDLEWAYHAEDKVPEGYQYFTQASPSKFIPKWSPAYSLADGLREYRHLLVENAK